MYADEEYYYASGHSAVPAADLSQALEDASDEVDDLCFGRIGDGSGLSAYESRKVKRAVRLLADWNYQNAEALSSTVAEYSIGDVSVKNFSSQTITQEEGYIVPLSVLAVLNSTALRNRNI